MRWPLIRRRPSTQSPKTAGVGAGTLYRHFPSRESLVLGVYRKEIDTLVALAPMLLTKHPPLQAFRIWCDRLAKSGRMKYGVADIVHAATSGEDLQETFGRMLGAVRQLIDACEGSGGYPLGNRPRGFPGTGGTLMANPSKCSRRSACEETSGACLSWLGRQRHAGIGTSSCDKFRLPNASDPKRELGARTPPSSQLGTSLRTRNRN